MSDNLPEVLAAIEAVKEKILQQIEATSVEVGQRLEQKAKNQIKGERGVVGRKISFVDGKTKRGENIYDYKNDPAISGQPPKNRTGNLRRNIRSESKRKGFGIYVAEVGSYMVYARVLELGGNPNWKNGQKFPYLQPALEQFIKTNSIKRILAKNLRKVI